ncbi:uncharacterized protein L969DRAFT_92921 [Mixia osmundae IAM 14324]|uniref:RRM domain-containing protein n=1 Tax=Mixia osmundae (strain CBS 9802 / IAM 14324 / JCM 22182 / KY 12970) TaxID=764103 RepID=G7DTS1_MIXOS|nr:uncharacterized protein L969DRAFT_92921 [Mixia osmundae IAM 14324]KEI41697.1 hypothetical protein L969DRAFT_92921 [Mixia osmundae IAM 14324]GAA93981.1 hypothetical protein E5Q_00628 [Mixia osmundae IAM 14324]
MRRGAVDDPSATFADMQLADNLWYIVQIENPKLTIANLDCTTNMWLKCVKNAPDAPFGVVYDGYTGNQWDMAGSGANLHCWLGPSGGNYEPAGCNAPVDGNEKAEKPTGQTRGDASPGTARKGLTSAIGRRMSADLSSRLASLDIDSTFVSLPRTGATTATSSIPPSPIGGHRFSGQNGSASQTTALPPAFDLNGNAAPFVGGLASSPRNSSPVKRAVWDTQGLSHGSAFGLKHKTSQAALIAASSSSSEDQLSSSPAHSPYFSNLSSHAGASSSSNPTTLGEGSPPLSAPDATPQAQTHLLDSHAQYASMPTREAYNVPRSAPSPQHGYSASTDNQFTTSPFDAMPSAQYSHFAHMQAQQHRHSMPVAPIQFRQPSPFSSAVYQDLPRPSDSQAGWPAWNKASDFGGIGSGSPRVKPLTSPAPLLPTGQPALDNHFVPQSLSNWHAAPHLPSAIGHGQDTRRMASTALPPHEHINPGNAPEDTIPTAIVIKNIPFQVEKDVLLQIMEELELPAPYAFNYHYDGGIFRGLAFANFKTPAETDACVAALNGFDIHGRKLRVEYKKVLQAGEKERIERDKAMKRMRSMQLEKERERFTRDRQESWQTPAMEYRPSQGESGIANPWSILDTGAQQMPASPGGSDIGLPGSEVRELDLNDPQTLQIYSRVLSFKDDALRDELAFARSLQPLQRRTVHLVAQRLGLNHQSVGLGDERYVVVMKDFTGVSNPASPTKPDTRIAMGIRQPHSQQEAAAYSSFLNGVRPKKSMPDMRSRTSTSSLSSDAAAAAAALPARRSNVDLRSARRAPSKGDMYGAYRSHSPTSIPPVPVLPDMSMYEHFAPESPHAAAVRASRQKSGVHDDGTAR